MEKLLRLIDRVSQAGVEPSVWQEVLADTSELVGAQSCTMFTFDLGRGENTRQVYHGANVEFGLEYGERFSHLNPHIRTMAAHPAGAVLADYMLVPRGELLRSAFYELWYRPQDIRWTMGCCVQRRADLISSFALRRHGRGSERFGEGAIRTMERLSPHLRRAVALNRRLAGEDGAALLGVLEAMADGVVVIGVKTGVRFVNAAAGAMLGAGARVAGGVLEVADRGARVALEEAVRRATGPGGEGAGCEGGCVRVERAGARPLVLLVYPMPAAPGHPFGRGEACALVICIDLGRKAPAARGHLRAVFGLTKAEAELAALLSQGMTMAEAAGALGCSILTARVHMKAVLTKTDTHRQAELVRLLLATVGPIGGGAGRA